MSQETRRIVIEGPSFGPFGQARLTAILKSVASQLDSRYGHLIYPPRHSGASAGDCALRAAMLRRAAGESRSVKNTAEPPVPAESCWQAEELIASALECNFAKFPGVRVNT